MKLFGVSQTTGVERRLYVERGVEGIVLLIKEHDRDKELERVLVRTEDLLPAMTDPTEGGTTVEGRSPAHGWKMVLNVEVRGNEVWLSAGPETGVAATDVAVGLDDFQDAVSAALGQA